jgi:hypothetical protein
MTLDKIKNVVVKALRPHVHPSILKDVRVFQETDADNEPILRFQVIIDDGGPDLSADRVFFATGIVRNALEAVNESRFPLLTFPSSDEIPGVAA